MAPNPPPPHHLGEAPFIILFLAPGFADSLFLAKLVKDATRDREGQPSIRWVEPGNDSVIDCPLTEIPLVMMEVPFRERGRIEERYRVKVSSLVLVTDHGNLVHDIGHKSAVAQDDVDIAKTATIDGFVAAARNVKQRDHIKTNGPVRIELIGKRFRLAYWRGSPA